MAGNAKLMARNRPLFLGQDTYRARRLTDAARLLPGLGLILFLLPLLFRPSDPATAFLYVFGLWVLLIVVVAVMARRLAQINLQDEDRVIPDDPSVGFIPGPGKKVSEQ